MKRKFTFIAAILGIVFAGLTILGGIILFSMSFEMSRYFSFIHWRTRFDVGLLITLILLSVLMIALSIIQIIAGALLIKKTRNPQTNPREFNGLLICSLVVTLFVGNLVTLGFFIAALCMNNDEDGTQQLQNNQNKNTFTVETNKEFTDSLCRLKQYRYDGIIDDATYKEKAEALFKKCYLDDEPK